VQSFASPKCISRARALFQVGHQIPAVKLPGLSKMSLCKLHEAWQPLHSFQQLRGGDPMSSGILRTAMSWSFKFKPDLPLVIV
jgi:hypothetical protein